MTKRTKLELTWIGKESRPRLEPRVLVEDPELSYLAKHRTTNQDIFDNRLIFGDNLLALKALEPEFSGKVKCIYIDPPYNTGNAFENYDDNLEHSIWLGLMRDRLECLHRLLRPDGFICCHIDDSEGQYLKVLLDEVFGRSNYLSTIYIQVRYAEKTLKQDMVFHKEIEYIHVYRKDFGAKPTLNQSDSSFNKFTHYIHELGPGVTKTIGGRQVQVFDPTEYRIVEGEGSEDGLKEIWATGTILDGNSSGRFFRDHLSDRVSEDGLGALYKVPNIGDDKFDHRYFTGPRRVGATKGKYFQGVPLAQLNDPDRVRETPIENYLDLAGSFGNCRHEGGVEFRSGKKPEKLIQFVLKHFSKPGDLVLDSFAGSGSTGAVAHKMRRQWIMVEIKDHCQTHIIPRMRNIIDGGDSTGETTTTGWLGGGGFRYFRLAPSLLEKDQWGNWVISNAYNPALLAEALCKLHGFIYEPNREHYWMQGHSSETDFIYTTTQTLTQTQIRALSDDVGDHRSLLVCCAAFKGDVDAFPNLTLKKIPHSVLAKCEWGKDDYSLNIKNLPSAAVMDPESISDAPTSATTPKRRGRPPKAAVPSAGTPALGLDEIGTEVEA